MAQGLEELLKNRDSIECLVLAPGCYDCAHIGHLKYFKEAKKLGTLVVAVSADEFVKKGINRPAFKQEQRIEMISALEPVDYVILNDKVDCSELIHLLKPEIVVKGNEYLHKNTPQLGAENDALCSTGGKMVYLDTQLSSSSFLINNYMSNLPEATTAFLQELKNTTSFLDIKNEIEKLQNIEITVLGETIIDKYTYGEALNKSSKNPTLVMNIKQNQIFAGGILAIANHLSTFVKKVNIITYLGELEEYKEFILSNLQQNINFYYIKKQHSPTIVKTRFIDSYYNQRLFETYDINQDLLSDVETDELIKLLPSKGNILIGDFGHGLINSHIIRHLYRKFSHICVNVQANAGNFGFNLLRKYYEGAYYSAIDLNELHLLMSDRTNNIETLIKELIKENWTPDYLSITTGKQGAQFFNRFNLQENYSSPAMTSSVIDTVGCGDQYFAITSLLMLNKCPHKYIPFIGCVGAAIKSKITGNSQFVSKNDLLQNIEILMK